MTDPIIIKGRDPFREAMTTYKDYVPPNAEDLEQVEPFAFDVFTQGFDKRTIFKDSGWAAFGLKRWKQQVWRNSAGKVIALRTIVQQPLDNRRLWADEDWKDETVTCMIWRREKPAK